MRLARGAPCGAVMERLVKAAGRGSTGLATAVRAWCAGGVPSLAMLDEEWQVEGVALAGARAALEAGH